MLLSAEHLSINFGSRQLLDDVNFYLNEGDKTGVIGINGAGKSTLLKVLAGTLEPDGGVIARNPNVQVSVLSQNPVMEDGATVLEQVFLHFPPEFRALNEYEAKSMLNRLGLPDCHQKVGGLSGGQRKRAALAAALIHPADVLVLDEPTNHLDSEMVAWLEAVSGRPCDGDPRPLFSGAGDKPHHRAEPGEAVPLRGQLLQVSGAAGGALRHGGGLGAQAAVHPPGGAGVDHAGVQSPLHQVQGADPAV